METEYTYLPRPHAHIQAGTKGTVDAPLRWPIGTYGASAGAYSLFSDGRWITDFRVNPGTWGLVAGDYRHAFPQSDPELTRRRPAFGETLPTTKGE